MKKAAVFCLAFLLALSVCACSFGEGTSTYTVGKYEVDQENCTISDGTNVYHYTFSGSASGYRVEITYPDGSTYWWNRQAANSDGIGFGSGGWSDDYDKNRYVSGDVLCDVLAAGAPAEKESKPGKVLLILFLLGIGLLNVISPETAWYLSDGWKFRDAEPSELSLELTRGGGILCIVIAVIIMFAW